MQSQKNKFDRVGLAITTSTKVQISSLVNTMLTNKQVEFNMIEEDTCNYFCPTWKLAIHAMATKVSQIASWVLVCSLP